MATKGQVLANEGNVLAADESVLASDGLVLATGGEIWLLRVIFFLFSLIANTVTTRAKTFRILYWWLRDDAY